MKSKKNVKVVMTLILALLFSSAAYAQSYQITGYQTKGSAGNNAKLECKPVKITKAVKIYSISGDNAGFWISKDGVTTHKFWQLNDPKAKGAVLQPGTYYIYPNLKQNQYKASVTIMLK